MTYNFNNSLVLSTINSSLPVFAGNGVTYNDLAKMFLTQGWTSDAGNTYQEGMRLSDKFVVKYNIGHGYYYTFLNGVNIYGYDGDKLRLIISDNSYNGCIWSEGNVKHETVRLLTKFFEDQCRINNCFAPSDYLKEIAARFVDDTIKATEAIGNQTLVSGNNLSGLLR